MANPVKLIQPGDESDQILEIKKMLLNKIFSDACSGSGISATRRHCINDDAALPWEFEY